MHVAQETLGFRRAGLSPALSLLMSAFALPIPPARVTPHLHRPTERSPTTPYAPPNALVPAHRLRSARDSTLLNALPACRLRDAPSSALGGAYEIPGFGVQFEPRYIFRAGRLDQ